MIVTFHAQERYRERCEPNLTIKSAGNVLRRLAKNAERTGERTPGGEEIWQSGSVRLVVRNDPQVGRVVVTVLPIDLQKESIADEVEIVEAHNREMVELLESSEREAQADVDEKAVAVRDAQRAHADAVKHWNTVRSRLGEAKRRLEGST